MSRTTRRRRLARWSPAPLAAGALVARRLHEQRPRRADGTPTQRRASAAAAATTTPGDEGRHRLLRPRRRPRLDRRHQQRRRWPRPRSTRTSTLEPAEGTNDVNQQISQVETFINDKVDAIVLLPTDGAALTDVATKAMEAGIPVDQRRPRVLRPVRRPHHGPRRQLRHGRLGRHLRLRS